MSRKKNIIQSIPSYFFVSRDSNYEGLFISKYAPLVKDNDGIVIHYIDEEQDDRFYYANPLLRFLGITSNNIPPGTHCSVNIKADVIIYDKEENPLTKEQTTKLLNI